MDWLPYLLIAWYASLLAFDLFSPARVFPRIRGWRARGLAAAGAYALVATALPRLTDGALARYRLLDATPLGTAAGALFGFLVLQLALYGWHRALHRVPLLWRFHRLHHSAERLDAFGAFWFHPLDVLALVVVRGLALVLVAGVTPAAALLADAATTACRMFQHANVRTPRWLGFVVQRPENHAVHHERGVHRDNYGDIALWDIVFGTFRNPPSWDGEAGFYDGASLRLADMLAGRDVSRPPGPQPDGPADPRPDHRSTLTLPAAPGRDEP